MDTRSFAEALIYRLLLNKDTAYAVMLQAVRYEVHSDPRGIIAYAGARAHGGLVIGVNKFWFNLIDDAAKTEILKHEVAHIVCGHIGPRGKALSDRYFTKYGLTGRDLVNCAEDIVVNQMIDPEPIERAFKVIEPIYVSMMAKDGKPGNPMQLSTYRFYGFPKNLTAEEYCIMLEPKIEQVKPNLMQGAELIYGTGASMEEAVKKLIEAGVQASSRGGRGFDSADLAEHIKQLNRASRTPWQQILRRHENKLRSCNRVQTLLRPSRRNPEHLGYRRTKKLHIWFVIDTSSSMNDELAAVNAELKGIAARGASIDVIHQDTEIKARTMYRGTLESFIGRGGTEFSPVFKELLDTPGSKKPAVVIVYTDGCGSTEDYLKALADRKLKPPTAGTTADNVPVIWLLTESSRYTAQTFKEVAAFGAVIRCLPAGKD